MRNILINYRYDVIESNRGIINFILYLLLKLHYNHKLYCKVHHLCIVKTIFDEDDTDWEEL